MAFTQRSFLRKKARRIILCFMYKMIRVKTCETTGFEPGKSCPGFLYVTLHCWPCVFSKVRMATFRNVLFQLILHAMARGCTEGSSNQSVRSTASFELNPFTAMGRIYTSQKRPSRWPRTYIYVPTQFRFYAFVKARPPTWLLLHVSEVSSSSVR